ncbi:ABC transporter substrate-binding protein [Pseudarthrobacter sp. PS3-L1]|uniref:ABC transporter substrate-binding protein n=1 Tax=Pseudarthrobacter sp. PS3-L1 TaxID=3046207 RepID=UPI0024BA98CB|nr:ABC transporter substrate-binding protein [Pseudarthrobacter sp. PS3-L1]MDJ0319004.1 ABC transporter substrate-binding protein [Pseudarthrobacter sp. PS3-L1]
MTQPRFLRSARIAAAGLAVSAMLLTGCTATVNNSAGTDPGANAFLTIPREDMGTFVQNFNPFAPTVNPMVQQSIYESLLIFNPAKGDTTPWLATEWNAAADGKSLTFTLRDGVKWSDGQPLVADDVAYSFELQKKLKGGFEYLDAVTADGNKVTFNFNKPWSPALYEVGQLSILPKHVWSVLADPDKDANANPVGTGPYTEVDSFQAQSFVLTKNPNYWQPEKQKIAGIKMLAFAGNDGANLAAANGDVDWAPQYIPNIEKTFVSKDPEHRQYWFPATGSMVNWQLNTTKAPFNDVDVRKALSMAVDRDQVTTIGMSGYAKPADCTGLSGNYETWKNNEVSDNCTWTKLDVQKANDLLDKAGYPKGADGKRTLKDGKPFDFKISVGATSSDWLSVANVISQNLAEVGVTAKVDSPDWAAVVAGYETGDFDSGIVWSANDPNPYKYFNATMGTATVKPVGTKTFDNYHRFGDTKADALLAEFAAEADESKQKDIANKLQEEYNDVAPLVPLFSGPEWGAFNDTRFTGWPTQDNPYATLSVRAPTTVLVLTTLEPRK